MSINRRSWAPECLSSTARTRSWRILSRSAARCARNSSSHPVICAANSLSVTVVSNQRENPPVPGGIEVPLGRGAPSRCGNGALWRRERWFDLQLIGSKTVAPRVRTRAAGACNRDAPRKVAHLDATGPRVSPDERPKGRDFGPYDRTSDEWSDIPGDSSLSNVDIRPARSER